MTESAGAPACPNCGAVVRPDHRFCGACGMTLPTGSGAAIDPQPESHLTGVTPAVPEATRAPQRPDAGPPGVPAPDRAAPIDRPAPVARPMPAQAGDDSLAYFISPNRIILLSFLTTGLYTFYWMYVTWRHYRDFTDTPAYPVCHALTLLVPVYQFFRLHAHIRVYQEMMQERGVPTTLRPIRTVGIFLVVIGLVWVAVRLTADPEVGAMTGPEQLGYFAANVARVGLMAWILYQAQGNINRYWQHRVGMRLANAPYSLVEVAMVVLGIINWIGWVVILLNPDLLITAAPEEAGPSP